MTNSKKILHFHTGRGGRFYNGGHTTFCGEKNIIQVLQMADESGKWNFINRENEIEIFKMLEKRGLENLVALFEKCRDNDDFSIFERKTGLELGEKVYQDSNGNTIISVEKAETGVGVLNFDNEYDSDECMLLQDCSEAELAMIADSSEWNKESLLQEYFDNNRDLKIEWKKFDSDRYDDLIADYFNLSSVVVDEFYSEQ